MPSMVCIGEVHFTGRDGVASTCPIGPENGRRAQVQMKLGHPPLMLARLDLEKEGWQDRMRSKREILTNGARISGMP